MACGEKTFGMTNEICVCTHSKEVHVDYEDHYEDNLCYSCEYPDRYHDFKMDNLNTIEYLAEKRGLV
jgi:hypothetical protein